METKECRRYKIKISYEASIVVDVDVSKGKDLTTDEIFELARCKALRANDSEFRIGDEIHQDVLTTTHVLNGNPMDDILEYIRKNSISNEIEDNDDENDYDEDEAVDGGI